jgi:hypothetical protein
MKDIQELKIKFKCGFITKDEYVVQINNILDEFPISEECENCKDLENEIDDLNDEIYDLELLKEELENKILELENKEV